MRTGCDRGLVALPVFKFFSRFRRKFLSAVRFLTDIHWQAYGGEGTIDASPATQAYLCRHFDRNQALRLGFLRIESGNVRHRLTRRV